MGLSAVQELERILKGMRAKGVRSVWLSEGNRCALTARPGQYSPHGEKAASAVSRTAAAASGISNPPVNQNAVLPTGTETCRPAAPQSSGGNAGGAFAVRRNSVEKMPPPPPIPPLQPSVQKNSAVPVPDGFVSSVAGMDWEGLEGAMSSCSYCSCSGRRGSSVFYIGDRNPAVMFIGDYPAEDECAGALPFDGPSGQMLYKMAVAMGLAWENAPHGKGAALANVLKCRPASITPPSEAIEVCGGFIRRQIELASPVALVLLGPLPVKVLADSVRDSFSQIEGKVIKCCGLPAVAIKHPSMIMRFAAHQDVFVRERRMAWTALQELMKIIF